MSEPNKRQPVREALLKQAQAVRVFVRYTEPTESKAEAIRAILSRVAQGKLGND